MMFDFDASAAEMDNAARVQLAYPPLAEAPHTTLMLVGLASVQVWWLTTDGAPSCPFPRHYRAAWQTTSCLCECHYVGGEVIACDDKYCRAITRWESRA